MFKYNPYVFIHQYAHKDRVFEIDPTCPLQAERTEDNGVVESSENEIGVVLSESTLEENEARILFDERSKSLMALDEEGKLPKQITETHKDYGKTLAGLYDMTKEEVSDIIRTEKLSQIRYFRDKELLATDWTALSDVPTKVQELFRPYRQYLRDLPNQEDLDNLILLDAPTK